MQLQRPALMHNAQFAWYPMTIRSVVMHAVCAKLPSLELSSSFLPCSGKFPPIPAHYSNNLKELVEALIKKEPEARPSLQDILDLAYVRHHMGLYRNHISRHITERQTSFQRSLSQFNLEAIVQVSTAYSTAG